MLYDDQFTKGVFKRLKIPAKEITFNDLDEILLNMGMILPYENLDIMAGTIKNISKNSLVEKLLIQKRGGLCYELNSLLYYF